MFHSILRPNWGLPTGMEAQKQTQLSGVEICLANPVAGKADHQNDGVTIVTSLSTIVRRLVTQHPYVCVGSRGPGPAKKRKQKCGVELLFA